MNIVSRAYNHFEINEKRGTITKTSSNKKLWDEAKYYYHIPDDFKIYFPRFVTSTYHGPGDHLQGHYELELEYYKAHNLGEYLIQNYALTSPEWVEIFDNLYDILDHWSMMKWESHLKNQMWKHGYEMYITKTVRECHNFVNQKVWPELFAFDRIYYNGKEYINFFDIWEMYTKKYIQSHMLENITFTFIHGDMCFANILYVDGHLRFIDPRGSFGGAVGVSGDPRYDVAKLSHSVYGLYEVLNTDSFVLQYSDNHWSVKPTCKVYSLGSFFDQRFFSTSSRFSRKEIRTIEGLIFIGACARHYENSKRQAALYLRGVQALNEAMNMGD